MGATKALPQSIPSSSIERIAFTVPEFCLRNNISRPTYHRLRQQGRAPAEMRIGLNLIRITAQAERDWQLLMQKPAPDLEQQALERAVKAGTVAGRSDAHVSKTRGKATPPGANPPRAAVKQQHLD